MNNLTRLTVSALSCACIAAHLHAAADERKVTIDVGVFDGQGQPVRGLSAGDFVVKVKGQARTVTGAELVSVNPEDPGTGPTGAEAGRQGRWIVIAIDESSVFAGSQKDLVDVAGRLLDRVAPADHVLVVPLPVRADYTAEFSSNVNAVQETLSRIEGRRKPQLIHLDMTMGEALAMAEENDTRTFEGLTTRYCPMMEQRSICLRSLLESAGDAAVTLQNQAKEVFVGLASMVDQLRERQGSKTVILLTGGTAISKRWAAVDELARRAAFGEVTVQGVYVEPKNQTRGHLAVNDPILDRREFLQRLGFLTDATRGGVFRTSVRDSETAQVLDRIMQQTTGWYRLQLDPVSTDNASTIANATIAVARKDVTVRARPLLLRGVADSVASPVDTTAGGGAGAGAGGTPESSSGPAPAAAANPIGSPALAALALSLAPAFGREQVLAPAVLGGFLDQLLGRTPKQSPALRTAVAAVRAAGVGNGQLAAATSASALAELTKVDPAATAFLRGIGLFDQSDLEAAAVQFRESLRSAPDFYPAMFYLGACYAAGHRDREAVGAWQTALITLSDVPIVYQVLTDAWLRLRDAGHATDFLDEATDHWPQDPALVKRRVIATLMAGQADAALTLIDRMLLESSPQAPTVDPDLLFAGIHLLHDALLAKQPIVSMEDDRGRAQHYGEVYRILKGAELDQVSHWLSEIKAR
jgi:tetratricopeptide (TPR) repeat protein